MSLLLYRVRELITRKHMTIAQLERILDFSGGSIARWDKSRPSVDKLQKVADYFEVSTDYLLGRTDEPYYKLTEKEKLDIGKEVDLLLDGLSTQAEVNFYGEPMTDEARASLRAAIQMAMELNKEKAKQAFTPKKYRN
ncbi:helix-turn-helix transcriptional regulator [uncultured Abiotrophia sp.]|uniref:helix-turn-helix domain-containing protein n=2 Tax=Abiotrophia TaxID=46123 RepID=UPI0028DC3758|nr:helix-turn-helix transcriptional regulator [uncultured Abiotrophia sp.]